MYKFLIIQLMLLPCSFAFAQVKGDQLSETKQILESLLPFHAKNKKQFNIEGCKTDKSKWMLLLIAKQSFTEKISFNKNCDIKGQYTTKLGVPFPVNLAIKKLKNFDQINFNFLIRIIYDPVPMIKVDMQNGKLQGKKDKIYFDVTYSAQIDPLSKKFIKNDKGGTIIIHKINEKKIDQSIPIKPRG